MTHLGEVKQSGRLPWSLPNRYLIRYLSDTLSTIPDRRWSNRWVSEYAEITSRVPALESCLTPEQELSTYGYIGTLSVIT